MTDYDDYENNLAFKPIGDWADTEPKVNTDRTQSSLELVDKIKRLTEENARLKELLKEVLRHDLSLKEVTVLTGKISQVLGNRKDSNV